MRKTFFTPALALAAMLAFSVSAVAQHGGGRPAGVGGGASGMGHGANAGMGGGMSGMGHANVGSQAPGSALSNQHLDTALINALGKSGITIPGGNLQSACGAFKNLGQCIAALHVSHNLGLSFADLQAKMTGSGSESLGKAIQSLGGANVNAKSEAKKANKQAHQDLNSADTSS